DGALARADDAGDDRHVVADHLVEVERGLRLVHQGRDVADVDRLVQVDELARLAQTVEELAEILLHAGSPKSAPTIKQWRGPPSRSAAHRADIVFRHASRRRRAGRRLAI